MRCDVRCGCVDVWLCGGEMCGGVDVWMYGDVDVWAVEVWMCGSVSVEMWICAVWGMFIGPY